MGSAYIVLHTTQHSIGYLDGGVYKGAKASLSVWAPRVESHEFSLGQIWVLSGTFEKDLNSLEAGWQACLYITLINYFIQINSFIYICIVFLFV